MKTYAECEAALAAISEHVATTPTQANRLRRMRSTDLQRRLTAAAAWLAAEGVA